MAKRKGVIKFSQIPQNTEKGLEKKEKNEPSKKSLIKDVGEKKIEPISALESQPSAKESKETKVQENKGQKKKIEKPSKKEGVASTALLLQSGYKKDNDIKDKSILTAEKEGLIPKLSGTLLRKVKENNDVFIGTNINVGVDAKNSLMKISKGLEVSAGVGLAIIVEAFKKNYGKQLQELIVKNSGF